MSRRPLSSSDWSPSQARYPSVVRKPALGRLEPNSGSLPCSPTAAWTLHVTASCGHGRGPPWPTWYQRQQPSSPAFVLPATMDNSSAAASQLMKEPHLGACHSSGMVVFTVLSMVDMAVSIKVMFTYTSSYPEKYTVGKKKKIHKSLYPFKIWVYRSDLIKVKADQNKIQGNHIINDQKSSHSSTINKINNIHNANAHICIHQK